MFFTSRSDGELDVVDFCLIDDVKNLSQIWAVARVLVKLALQDDQPSQR
jgi:hypothetical protein